MKGVSQAAGLGYRPGGGSQTLPGSLSLSQRPLAFVSWPCLWVRTYDSSHAPIQSTRKPQGILCRSMTKPFREKGKWMPFILFYFLIISWYSIPGWWLTLEMFHELKQSASGLSGKCRLRLHLQAALPRHARVSLGHFPLALTVASSACCFLFPNCAQDVGSFRAFFGFGFCFTFLSWMSVP